MPKRPHTNPTRRRPGQGRIQKWVLTHRQVAVQSGRRLLDSPVSSGLTVFVIAVSLLLPALLFTLNASLSELLAGFQQDTRIALYLTDSTTNEEALQVSEDLLTRPDIAAVEYISREQGLAEFSAASGLGGVLAQLPTNPLPTTLLITPADAEAQRVDALAVALAELPQVALAQLDSQWLLRLEALSSLIAVIGSGLGAIVVLGLFVIVGNTIKLAIENRRREISVIKLVGGTDSFIARPFLYSGLFYGGAGGLLAVLLQAIIMSLFNAPLQDLASLYEARFALPVFRPGGALLLTLAGAAIGWVAALFASYRHIWSLDP